MLPKPTLTDRQLAILVFIKDHSRDEGMPPTRAEIATQFGFKSSNAAQEHLKALEKKGYIAMRTGFARSIKVLP